MHDPHSTHDFHNDPAWACFRYLAGELTPEEVVDFELALAEDQALREALASEVELVQAIAAAETTRTVTLAPAAGAGDESSRSWAGRARWMGIGALLSLTLVLLWQVNRWTYESSPADSLVGAPSVATAEPSSHTSAQQLALAWTTARDEPTADELLHWIDPSLEERPAALAAGAEQFLAEEEADLLNASPSWMLAAVASMQGGKPADESDEIPFDGPSFEGPGQEQPE